MTRKFIPAEESFQEWRKDPDYVAAYDAQRDEFALTGAKIKPSSKAIASIRETAEGLHAAGFRDKHAMPKSDEACPSPPERDAAIARSEDKTDWARASAKSEEELAADTASDPAWNGIAEDWHKDAVARTGLLFRPKENKQPVHIRFDADVLEFFKRGGRGWQGRMNAVLRSFMERQH